MLIATHGGKFHADDAWAVAVLKVLFPDAAIIRTREQAEAAVRTLLSWAGDDPRREGLLDTPKRVVNAYSDWFSGYGDDPRAYLERTFEEVAGYDELIVLRDIEYERDTRRYEENLSGYQRPRMRPYREVELTIGIEPTTSALPRRRSAD